MSRYPILCRTSYARGYQDAIEALLSGGATDAATDRIAWAMLVESGEKSPRAAWDSDADEWRRRAEGVWASTVHAAVRALIADVDALAGEKRP